VISCFRATGALPLLLRPGFLQTPAYASALLSAHSGFHGTPDDVEDPRLIASQVPASSFTHMLSAGLAGDNQVGTRW
jgi:hypothetical protein